MQVFIRHINFEHVQAHIFIRIILSVCHKISSVGMCLLSLAWTKWKGKDLDIFLL